MKANNSNFCPNIIIVKWNYFAPLYYPNYYGRWISSHKLIVYSIICQGWILFFIILWCGFYPPLRFLITCIEYSCLSSVVFFWKTLNSVFCYMIFLKLLNCMHKILHLINVLKSTLPNIYHEVHKIKITFTGTEVFYTFGHLIFCMI